MRETQGQIQGMKDRVVEAQKAMERAVREHKELNERLEREFAEKDQRLRAIFSLTSVWPILTSLPTSTRSNEPIWKEKSIKA